MPLKEDKRQRKVKDKSESAKTKPKVPKHPPAAPNAPSGSEASLGNKRLSNERVSHDRKIKKLTEMVSIFLLLIKMRNVLTKFL